MKVDTELCQRGTYTVSEKKQLLPITSPNVYRFSKFFSGRLSGKFESHLKYVATPPCEISVFKNIAM